MNTLNTIFSPRSGNSGLKRLNQILIAALILQLLVAGVVFWPRSAASESGGLSLDGFSAEDVVKITIADDSNQEITLQKSSEGWALPESDDYPVEADSVSALLDKVVGLKTNRLVTRTDASHKRLKVATDDFMRRVTLETADGQQRVLYIGSSPGQNATHVRLEGQNESYLAGDLSVWEIKAAPAGWIDTLYFNVNSDDLSAFSLQNAQGKLSFSKDAQGNWAMDGLGAGEKLLTGTVSSLVNKIASIRMVEPIGKTEQPDFGLKRPQATVIVTVKTESDEEQTSSANSEQVYTIRVGAKNADEQYVLSASTSPYFVRAAKFTVEDFVSKSKDDFLVKPEE